MKLKVIWDWIVEVFTYQEIITELNSDIVELNEKIDSLNVDILNYDNLLEAANSTIFKLESDLNDLNQAPIDKVLSSKYKVIENIRYKQKRKFNGTDIDTELNQYIRPEQFEVQKVVKRLSLKDKEFTAGLTSAGNWEARTCTWTDDKNLDTSGDYYLYPEEILVAKKGDCEDFSYLLASFFPKNIGVAYGFYHNDDGTKFGHAFNIYENKGDLFIAETTGNSLKTYPISTNKYEIYFIITQQATYRVKSGVSFGTIAGWD